MVSNLKKKFQGERLTVVHCEGALESFENAINSVNPPKRRTGMAMWMVRQIEQLANKGRLSGDNYPLEGNLPKNGGKFRALKKIPIRGYCWHSKKHPHTVFISHYIYKAKDKLDPKDTDRVVANWRKIEE